MAGPPLLIASQGQAASPASYTIPGTQEIRLSSVHATFDGSAAGGDFLACLSIYAQSGELLSRTFPTTGAITAGSSAEVSYFPFPPSQSSAATLALSNVYYNISTSGTLTVPTSTNTGVPLVLGKAYGAAASLLSYNAADKTVIISTAGGHTRWLVVASGRIRAAANPTANTGEVGMSVNGGPPGVSGAPQITGDYKLVSVGSWAGLDLACSCAVEISTSVLAAEFPLNTPRVGLSFIQTTGINWTIQNGDPLLAQLGFLYLGLE